MSAYSKLYIAFEKYPLLRGVAAYGIAWPTSSLIQQSFQGRNHESYDWWRCARYSLYGSCYVAPTFYAWLTLANNLWPGNSFRSAMIKTAVESVTYSPFGMCSFFFGMSLLENKSIDEGLAEVTNKFWPTYKVAISVWPAIALINFRLIPPKNRLPFVSLCSLAWTTFLAYVKHKDEEKQQRQQEL